jgi:hypothetical protein
MLITRPSFIIVLVYEVCASAVELQFLMYGYSQVETRFGEILGRGLWCTKGVSLFNTIFAKNKFNLKINKIITLLLSRALSIFYSYIVLKL